jgi:hypothetical protein
MASPRAKGFYSAPLHNNKMAAIYNPSITEYYMTTNDSQNENSKKKINKGIYTASFYKKTLVLLFLF